MNKTDAIGTERPKTRRSSRNLPTTHTGAPRYEGRCAIGKGDTIESFIVRDVQTSPPHLPEVRVRRGAISGSCPCPLRLLRRQREPRRSGSSAADCCPTRGGRSTRLRVRPSRDAPPARRDNPLPGLRLGGPSPRREPKRARTGGTAMKEIEAVARKRPRDQTEERLFIVLHEKIRGNGEDGEA